MNSVGHNLVGATDGSSGWVSTDLTGTAAAPRNARLAPLGSYGGPTETMPPLAGSPAIGAGTAADYPFTQTPITTDQRGLIRGSVVDIGAVQVSLVVESADGLLVTSAAGLTLPGGQSGGYHTSQTHQRSRPG